MCADDFVELTYSNFGSMSTAATENRFPIIGTGIVAYDAISKNGTLHCWTYPANLCKAAGTRLSSPQVCSSFLNLDARFPIFQSNLVFASLTSNSKGDRITVPIDPSTSLPIVKAQAITKSKDIPSHHHTQTCRCAAHQWCRCSLARSQTASPQALTAHQYISLFDPKNHNLTGPQRQLLLDHHRLGHIGMQRLQRLYNPNGPATTTFDAPSPTKTGEPCLRPAFRTSSTCDIPKCKACLYGKARRCTPKVVTIQPRADAGRLPTNLTDLQPGGLVSIDHFESSEQPHHRYVGGTLFYDHKSRSITVGCQITLGTPDTLRSKASFEELLQTCGRRVQRYHLDNGVFTSDAFKQALQRDATGHKPVHTLSGVGAHHQNGGAERAIQTVVSVARCMLLHCHLRWSDAFCPSLWPMALDYAAWIYNHVPHKDTGLAPMEILTGSRMDCTHLRRARVWGCPSYVLDSRLQDGHKVPKWDARSRQGQFLGFSPSHSTTVGMIRNLHTNHISPQFHVVHDELFQTVHSDWMAPHPDDPWIDFFQRDNYLDNGSPPDPRDGPIPPPDLMWDPHVIVPPPLPPRQPSRHEGEHSPSVAPQQLFDSPSKPTINPANTPLPSPKRLADPGSPFENLNDPPPQPASPQPASPQFHPAEPADSPGTTSSQNLGELPSRKQGKPLSGKQGKPLPEKQGEPPLKQGEPPAIDKCRSKRIIKAPRRFPDPDRHVRFDDDIRKSE